MNLMFSSQRLLYEFICSLIYVRRQWPVYNDVWYTDTVISQTLPFEHVNFHRSECKM